MVFSSSFRMDIVILKGSIVLNEVVESWSQIVDIARRQRHHCDDGDRLKFAAPPLLTLGHDNHGGFFLTHSSSPCLGDKHPSLCHGLYLCPVGCPRSLSVLTSSLPLLLVVRVWEEHQHSPHVHDCQFIHTKVRQTDVFDRIHLSAPLHVLTAQYIQSATHHPVSARTIRRRLQQSGLSAKRLLLRLPFTQNHRRLHRQWCDERRMWTEEWNEIVFTDESRFCLQHHDGWIRVWRHLERGCRTDTLCIATLVLHRVLWYGAVLDITLALL
ncbi:hypothetical protein LAZ67_18001735 [Cordylochernes scorpioides]|uniref:Transposase Tc1-like domain-containing protein n=1 Tax=Cordylochernes scorpioides TaxID=51811 RepID=A0ABY6LFY8_9ARAC|nr:hypothetical protein LAZ67_18001735 [Cordylochernes scorpioides]